MKPRLLLLSVITLHFLVRTFWNFHFVIPEDTPEKPQGTNIYLLGIAFVFLLWTYYSKALIKSPPDERERKKLSIINGTWQWFVWNDVLKEASRTTGYLQSYFFNPLEKHLAEYVIWGVATLYVIYRLKRSV